MLEEILLHIHNRFDYAFESKDYVIDNGVINCSILQEGQYYWIEGSIFNDGLHQHVADDLKDEAFSGRVVFLAIPRAVTDLAERIKAWCDANTEALDSPYASESFGGYSYSKASANGGSDGVTASGWRLQFINELNHWRKLGSERW